MHLSDFSIGNTYKVKLRDWVTPDGYPVKGKSYHIEVLPPAENPAVCDGISVQTASEMEKQVWRKFLRVKRDTGRVHLLHPGSIEYAEPVSNQR